jgi:Flp pilus assembly pilin Flp
MMNAMLRALVRIDDLRNCESDGQSLVEYSMILLIVVIACIGILSQIGDILRTNWVELAANMFPG